MKQQQKEFANEKNNFIQKYPRMEIVSVQFQIDFFYIKIGFLFFFFPNEKEKGNVVLQKRSNLNLKSVQQNWNLPSLFESSDGVGSNEC